MCKSVTQGEHNLRKLSENPKLAGIQCVKLDNVFPGSHGMIHLNQVYNMKIYDPNKVDEFFPIATVNPSIFIQEEQKLGLTLLSGKFPNHEVWTDFYNHDKVMVELFPNNLSVPHAKFYAEWITDNAGLMELIIIDDEIN